MHDLPMSESATPPPVRSKRTWEGSVTTKLHTKPAYLTAKAKSAKLSVWEPHF